MNTVPKKLTAEIVTIDNSPISSSSEIILSDNECSFLAQLFLSMKGTDEEGSAP